MVNIKSFSSDICVAYLFESGSKDDLFRRYWRTRFSSLLPTLVAVFLFAALFLPLLMEYGLLELLGPVFRPVMRPLFTLPGRSTVDNLASFIGDGTVGVLITSRQYEEGFYSRREATVISTTFSVVSITFAIVIASTIKMQDQFFYFYITVIISCLIAAMIMPRIWPLKIF